MLVNLIRFVKEDEDKNGGAGLPDPAPPLGEISLVSVVVKFKKED